MDIPKVADVIAYHNITVFHNMCKVPGPSKDINCELLALYMISGHCEPGTLLERVVHSGVSPMNTIVTLSDSPLSQTIDDNTIEFMSLLNEYIISDKQSPVKYINYTSI